MAESMKIVGLSGFAKSGKDEAAKALVIEGYERIAFADVLKDVALALDPYVFDQTDPPEDGVVIFQRLSSIIQNYGWDWAKNNLPDVRRLLQRLGTEAGRDILGENIWVDTAFSRASASKVVVTDVRFPNEAEAIKERGGVVVRITRPGVGPLNDHPSETSLLDYEFDVEISNSGTIDDLHTMVKELA